MRSGILFPMPSSAEPLHPIEASELHARRERVFLLFAGLFLGSMAMLNILGVTRFLDLFETTTSGGIPMVLRRGRSVPLSDDVSVHRLHQ